MQIQIKNARLSFANIRQPWRPKTGDAKYTANFICSDDTTVVAIIDGKKRVLSHDKVQKIFDHMCKDKWQKTPPKLENYAYNCADGSTTRDEYTNKDREYHDGYDSETMFFVAGTKEKDAPEGILIVDQRREPVSPSAAHPVSGDYVNAMINLFCYEYEGKKGISASLEAIQYKLKGEPFGASKVEASAFDEEELEEEDMDDDEDLAF